MDFSKEHESKRFEDQSPSLIAPGYDGPVPKRVWVPGPVIIGAGPAGLAVAACLKKLGIPRLILERSSCIASMWRLKTYDRLRLHLPKHFCELPDFPFPVDFPTYPTKNDFIAYLEAYAKRFGIRPAFNMEVVRAVFDRRCGVWRVRAVVVVGEYKKGLEMIEYVCRWVVVATGENAEAVVPKIEGGEEYEGRVMHTSEYKSGEEMKGKNVMVVGCGNSGMEVCLDLSNHGAFPSLVVRDSVHVLPQEMLGTSTFGLSKRLLKWFPVQLVDRILLLVSRLVIGDTSRFGLHRPAMGPLELKNAIGKTPVLDVGTLAQIRAGNIKVFPGIRRIFRDGAEFVDGRVEKFDAIIFATGFKNNVKSWLEGSNMISEEKSHPYGWKDENGLYAAGFTKQGILGLSLDARRIAQDIHDDWRCSKKQIRDRPPTKLTTPECYMIQVAKG